MKRATGIAIAVGLALGLGTALVVAQPYGYGMGGGMMGGGMGPGMMGGGMGPGMMAFNVEDRLAAQKSALKITPEQERAWSAYADTTKKQADAMLAQRDAMHKAAPATAVERSDAHSKFMKERSEQIEAGNAAFKGLYTVLTPEQRAVFDQRPGFGSPMHGPGGRSR